MLDNLIIDPVYRGTIAIVVVGYNRRDSMKRLLASLLKAIYPNQRIPLVISIDCSGNEDIYNDARTFVWPYGDKYVIIQKERLGLKNHIIKCGDLTRFFRAIILLEDDIFVSDFFYKYASEAVDFYYDDDLVGGISLYQNEVMGQYPAVYLNDGSSTYLKQTPASWGECWTDKQWGAFKEWLEGFSDECFINIDMPTYMKGWKRAWSKYFMAYLIDTGRYFVFPYISLTTCFGDAGEHSTSMSSLGQVNCLAGDTNFVFHSSQQMVKYDIYGVNEQIYEWIGYEKNDLCVDWHGTNPNKKGCRYFLTPIEMDLPIIKSYGLQMRPIELNIKNNIRGTGIFLYDTEGKQVCTEGKKLPVAMAHYYLRFFSRDLIIKYSIDILKWSINRRLRFLCHK